MTICFYHKSDFDGKCSGAIVAQQFTDCTCYGVDYLDKIEDYEITKGEIVFVVDFCFTVPEMKKLNENTVLHWIDHHKSSIEKMESIGIHGVRDTSKAACELTWAYLNHKKPMPLTVQLLGRYDVWDHKNPLVLPFQYGLRTYANTDPEQRDFWGPLFKDDQSTLTEHIIDVGHTILKYEAQQNEYVSISMSFEAKFHGLRAIIINRSHANSKVFQAVYDPLRHDIMILFGVKKDEIKYTLFCDKPEYDVSKIAIVYGGGGHKGAAGFYRNRLIDFDPPWYKRIINKVLRRYL